MRQRKRRKGRKRRSSTWWLRWLGELRGLPQRRLVQAPVGKDVSGCHMLLLTSLFSFTRQEQLLGENRTASTLTV